VPSLYELCNTPGYPDEERIKKGPVAVIECVQEIVCNACIIGCPSNCIKVESLKELPEIKSEKCIGCGLCIPSCPGLAIFVIDYNYSEEEALISFGYELYPMPKVGEIVDATNREGKIVTNAKVIKVLANKEFDKTTIVSIAVPKKYFDEVRGIKN
jgi:Fe-S-cluster-containing hydrogenase component 2